MLESPAPAAASRSRPRLRSLDERLKSVALRLPDVEGGGGGANKSNWSSLETLRLVTGLADVRGRAATSPPGTLLKSSLEMDLLAALLLRAESSSNRPNRVDRFLCLDPSLAAEMSSPPSSSLSKMVRGEAPVRSAASRLRRLISSDSEGKRVWEDFLVRYDDAPGVCPMLLPIDNDEGC